MPSIALSAKPPEKRGRRNLGALPIEENAVEVGVRAHPGAEMPKWEEAGTPAELEDAEAEKPSIVP